MKFNYLAVAAASLFLNGCGSVPSCSDETVKELVTQIADEQIGFQLGAQLSGELANQQIELDLKKIGWNVESIRTIDTNKKNNLASCAAKVQIMYDGKAYFEHDVEYTAQPTDDGKNVYVEATF